LLERMDEVATSYNEKSLRTVREQGRKTRELLEGMKTLPILAAK
jgi:hypothetical protein